MNKSDSERIAAVLENMNYKPASDISGADLVVVNMCSVRQSAVDRVYGLYRKFRKLREKNKGLKTILTGCVLKKDKTIFKERFDLILDIKNLATLPRLLTNKKNYVAGFRSKNYLKIKPRYETSFRAYIPIIVGCSNFCSYCVVPHARGPEVSRPAEEIICEIKQLVKRGYKDIWLLGENVNSYRGGLTRIKTRTNAGVNFPKLLRLINNIPGEFWVSFTSSHPKDFSDELIGTVAKCGKVNKYISLPIQSGDDAILKKMNRPYAAKEYKNLVRKICKKIPGVAISTDVIVGFPGETKKQFENTVKLFKEMKFDMAYIAQYSERAGTAADKMEDNVSHQEKERREKVLTEVLKQTAAENNRKYIGKIVEVIVEERKNQFLIGKTRTYKTVKFESDKDLTGKIVKVKIIDAMPWGLKGEFVN